MALNLLQYLPKVTSISEIHRNILMGTGCSKGNMSELISFYNSFPSSEDIESGILDFVMNKTPEQRNLILKSLNDELSFIYSAYNDNRGVYDNIILENVYLTEIKALDSEIDRQHKKTLEASYELREVLNSYEMTPFNGMSGTELEILEKKVGKLRAAYDCEKSKLNKLYAEKTELDDINKSIPAKIFRDIKRKCQNFLSIVQKYVPSSELSDKDNKVTTNDNPSIQFLPMNLIASIHEACNGVQFEKMLAIDFYNAINLNPNNKPIIVKKNEKIRVCYLINQLAELLPQERKVQWVEKILERVGIDYNYYRAKYRVPVGDLPSEANQEFAETLKEIFRQINNTQ